MIASFLTRNDAARNSGRFNQVDAAAIPEQGTQSAEEEGADVFDAGDAGAGGEGFFAEMNVNNGAGPGPVRIKRRRHQLQRPMLAVLADRVSVFRVSLVRVCLMLLGLLLLCLILGGVVEAVLVFVLVCSGFVGWI
jgi:hypothetical protein